MAHSTKIFKNNLKYFLLAKNAKKTNLGFLKYPNIIEIEQKVAVNSS